MLESLLNKKTTLLKRHSNTGVFVWILRNCKENLFSRTSANNCFYCRFSYAEAWELLNLFVRQKYLATIFFMQTNQVLRLFLLLQLGQKKHGMPNVKWCTKWHTKSGRCMIIIHHYVSNYRRPVSSMFKEKIEGTLGATNIKPTTSNVS